MTESLKNFLAGAGSVLDLMPANDYGSVLPKGSAAERMQGHWEKTGSHLQRAMDRFADEQKKEAK